MSSAYIPQPFGPSIVPGGQQAISRAPLSESSCCLQSGRRPAECGGASPTTRRIAKSKLSFKSLKQFFGSSSLQEFKFSPTTFSTEPHVAPRTTVASQTEVSVEEETGNQLELISHSPAWEALEKHIAAIDKTHLKELLKDEKRVKAMTAEFDGITLDYSRQRATLETVELLKNLADAAHLEEKIKAMFTGDHINVTENRAALHIALRAPADKVIIDQGVNVVPDVHKVLAKIEAFSETVRSGTWLGATGKPLTNVVSIGIGGSYLGPEFAYEGLRVDKDGSSQAAGRKLRFLANVDPVAVEMALEGLDPESTLVVVVSKTFTTAETMLNARTVRSWLLNNIKGQPAADVVLKHMVAVSTNLEKVAEFGIDPDNAFGFWDWVGGRFSVTSAVGVVPLALHYSYPVVKRFLEGAYSMDQHLATAPLLNNIPVILGLLGVWNSSFLGYQARALLPYAQALARLPAHIQQVDMESNGKRVALNGTVLDFAAGEVDFGEPGTNGQHSFYQLIHQGRIVPCDFLGFVESQKSIELDGEPVSNHDELMANFFAQPDALAIGKTAEELRKEGIPERLVSAETFPGNRPSSSLLFPKLDAYVLGQILALYEHRTVVQGFIWDIDSFDQWGVELGKQLAKNVRNQLSKSRKAVEASANNGSQDLAISGFNLSTSALLNKYLRGGSS